jgi:hypothetical protein
MRLLSRIFCVVAAVLCAAAPAASQAVLRVTVGLDGAQPDGANGLGVVSGDGRFVAYASQATNLVAGDTNGSSDVFVRDLAAATTSRVSLAVDGQERVGHSGATYVTFLERELDISDDGRYVVFTSSAALVPSDTNTCVIVPGDAPVNCPDIYLRDRQTSETIRISVAPGGADANGSSTHPRISGDGRFVVFESAASNLVAGDTNDARDVFLVDRQNNALARVSVGPAGAQVDAGGSSPAISDNGTVVGFVSTSAQLSAEPNTVLCQPIPGLTTQPPCFRPFLFDRGRAETVRVPMPPVQTSGFVVGNPTVTYTIRVEARAVVPSDDGSSVAVGVTTTSTLLRHGIPIIADRGWIYDRALDRIVYDRPGMTPYTWTGRVLAYQDYEQGPQATAEETVRLGLFEPGWSLHEALTGGTLGQRLGNLSDDGRIAAFWSITALVGSDTNAAGDIYVLDRDPDADGMPSTWESRFGFDPAVADGTGDPDADGLSNVQEYDSTGSHPRGTHVRYLAEGAHNGFFHTQISVVGLGRENGATPDQTAVVRYSNPSSRVWSEALTLVGRRPHSPALSVGLAGDFSTIVESDGPIVVDRVMTWGSGTGTGWGSHAETAGAVPGTTWHLAEGATHGAFDLFYLIQNPGAAPNDITITYLRPSPLTPITRTFPVGPQSRTTVQVDAVPGLESTDVSAVITSTAPILVERAMYMSVLSQRPPVWPFVAGHAGAAVAAPSDRWFLAEGATGPFFDLYYLLANPTTEAAQARVTYLRPSGAPIVRTYTVAAQSRLTISVENEDPGLDNTPVSALVESLNGARLVVERSMWWPGGGQWQEGHLAAGTTSAARRWVLAAGQHGGAANEQMFVLIANTSSTGGTATLTGYPEGPGLDFPTHTVTLPPNSRTTLPMHAIFPQFAGGRFSTFIESDGPEIVVERALYSDHDGVVWAAGSDALGTPIP